MSKLRFDRRSVYPRRGRRASRCAIALEMLEDRLVLDGAPDITLLSATTHDAQRLSITYQVNNPNLVTFQVSVYRSDDAVYDGLKDSQDRLIDTTTIDTASNRGSDTFALNSPLRIDPSRPYVWVVASSTNQGGAGNPYSEISFRIYTLGAVTHGFEYRASDAQWVDVMAESLKEDGYDAVVPFNWTAYSSLPLPGMIVLAGEQMASYIVQAGAKLFPQMNPDDVIALHMLGHSRGSAVISQAALDIEHFVAQDPGWSRLVAGPWKMTFLDPHPAHNTGAKFYDAAPNLLGKIATAIYTQFQAVANDPYVVVPDSVDWAEVYHQNTPYFEATDPLERIFISWGETPVYPETSTTTSTIVNYCDLTGTVFGHYAVHTWYQNEVVPKLSTDPGFICPNRGSSMASVTTEGSHVATITAASSSTADPLSSPITPWPGERSAHLWIRLNQHQPAENRWAASQQKITTRLMVRQAVSSTAPLDHGLFPGGFLRPSWFGV
jgi:hypothetical protein